MPAFEPVGDRARWRSLYDLLRAADVGDVVTYEDLAAAADVDPDVDRVKVQLAMRRAARELETEDRRALEVVPNVGYRVVQPEEHLDLAARHQRKAGRSLARGHSKVTHVDLHGMAPDVRKAFEVVAGAFAAQIDFNRRLSGRQADLEKVVADVTQRTERTDEELAELRERLRRLEGKTGSSESE